VRKLEGCRSGWSGRRLRRRGSFKVRGCASEVTEDLSKVAFSEDYGGHSSVLEPFMSKPILKALVLQGRGALGAYELGVARVLYGQQGYTPDIIAGASIGAVAAALLARPKNRQPLEALEAFWQASASTRLFSPSVYGYAAYVGTPDFSRSRFDFESLRQILSNLVDESALANPSVQPRLLVTATDVVTGRTEVFDSAQGLTLDHILASCNMPPSFSVTRIEGEAYWEGSLFDNTPLGAVIERMDRSDVYKDEREIIIVNLFPDTPGEPNNLTEVSQRIETILFSNRTASDLKLTERFNAVARFMQKIRGHPQWGELASSEEFLAADRNYIEVSKIIPITRFSEVKRFEGRDFSPEEFESRVEEGMRATDNALIRSTGDGFRLPMIVDEPGISGPPALADLDQCEYRVWYGTNRRPNDKNSPFKGYSVDQDECVHHGYCHVYVPKSHKIGSIGSSWLRRVLSWTDDRLAVRMTCELEEGNFWEEVKSQLSRAEINDRHAVVFIHGYNTSFEDAALRTAQIGFDLSIKGAMAFFSWPSQGRLTGYMADTTTIEASEDDIADFMTAFAARSGADAVHIIAHSMGNRGVLRAVNRIAQKAQERTGVMFGQIILAAADVHAKTFRRLATAYNSVARQTTLYISEHDRAVETSYRLHSFPRVGLMPPVCIVPGVDTISVSNLDVSYLGHGYVAEARGVLTDMHDLITTGRSPAKRFGMSEYVTDQGERYWLFRA
jgi:esterase/lipase superfamily enzyme/predicted acylesterase/phospholipase RssA